MDISVLGASGTIGRQIVIALVQRGTLSPVSRLQMVGRRGGASEQTLMGLKQDLLDAYEEQAPELDVALSADDVLGDVIIVAAGATASTDPQETANRADLAEANADVFEMYAKALAAHGHGEEIILIVTNPVELGVHIFCKYHDRRRVIGMGAYLDTMRFRRLLAGRLGIRRQKVRGLVVGQHGPGMIPLWSTVGAYGFSAPAQQRRLDAIRCRQSCDFAGELARLRDILINEGSEAAFAEWAGRPVEVQLYLEPWLIHYSGAKTAVGSAEIVMRMVETILSGSETLEACQAKVDGEFLGIHAVSGAPVLLSNCGISRIVDLPVNDRERKAIVATAEKLNETLAAF